MYDVSTHGIDERMINVHYYYCYCYAAASNLRSPCLFHRKSLILMNTCFLYLSPGVMAWLNAWKRTGTEQGGMFIYCSLCRSERA